VFSLQEESAESLDTSDTDTHSFPMIHPHDVRLGLGRHLAFLVAALILGVTTVSPVFGADEKKSNAVEEKKSNDSRLEWFAKQVTATGSIALTITIGVVIVLAVRIVRRELRRATVVIDPIDVPADLAASREGPGRAHGRCVRAQHVTDRLYRTNSRSLVSKPHPIRTTILGEARTENSRRNRSRLGEA